MKQLFLLILFCVSVGAVAQSRDVVRRLRQIDAQGYRMAIADMEKNNRNFKADERWRSVLAEVEQNRNQLIADIEKGSKSAAGKASGLLSILDAVLLSNPLLRDKEVMFVSRTIKNSRSAMGGALGIAPSNFQNSSEIGKRKTAWSNEFVVVSGFGGDKLKSRIAFKPTEGVLAGEIEPHFSGEKVMFTSVGTNDRLHLFELDVTTGGVKQLTPAQYEDFDSFDGCYTPDGRYIFCATATFLGLPCTDGANKMSGLFQYDPKSGKTRQLTFDQDSNWEPSVLPSGEILYQRWEYADLPHSNSRYIFTMNPDGTSQAAYYGSGSYFPTSLFGARAVPGGAGKFVGIAGGHHSVSRSGQLLVIDPMVSRREAEGVIAEIPYRGKKTEPIVRDRLSDGLMPQFLNPYPLSDKYILVSMKSAEDALWGVYLVDTFNNMTLIAEAEGAALIEPVVIAKTATPPVIPDRIKPGTKSATIFIQDIYYGDGLKGIPRGAVKRLRIGTYNFSPVGQGGLLGMIGLDGPWDVKYLLGEVDVEADGSAMFEVPANTPLFFQPLDSMGKALQIMRSWTTAMPGETQSCIGCHEDRNSMAIPKRVIASTKTPQKIQQFYGRARGYGFRQEVQPILDRNCVSCHNGENPSIPYLRGDKMLTDWSSDIAGAVWEKGVGGQFSESYYQLQRYVRRPGIESDIAMLNPMDVHADQTELMQILNKGHKGVVLSDEDTRKLAVWIDYNTQYHGRRTETSTYPRTAKALKLRSKYEPMLDIDSVNLEWIPEYVENIRTEKPLQPVVDKGVTELSGWGHYKTGESYEAWNQVELGQYQKNIEIAPGLKLELVKVPAGQYIMGSDRNPDEMPMTVQAIEQPYWIGRFEITNEQYAAFDPTHDSRNEYRHGYQFGRRGYPLNEQKQPVVRISWEQAMAYCKWLSEKTGLKISLPTESQWEWAARAGSADAYTFGEPGSDYSRHANLGDKRLAEFAACTSYKFYESTRVIENPNRYDDWIPRDDKYDDAGFVSTPVGHYRANQWDLYDMCGNVWEWTLSTYKSYPYSEKDGRNDLNSDSNRTVRGGSWYDRPSKATSSYRLSYRPYQQIFNVGFRIVVTE